MLSSQCHERIVWLSALDCGDCSSGPKTSGRASHMRSVKRQRRLAGKSTEWFTHVGDRTKGSSCKTGRYGLSLADPCLCASCYPTSCSWSPERLGVRFRILTLPSPVMVSIQSLGTVLLTTQLQLLGDHSPIALYEIWTGNRRPNGVVRSATHLRHCK